jgi:hypothetical protein
LVNLNGLQETIIKEIGKMICLKDKVYFLMGIHILDLFTEIKFSGESIFPKINRQFTRDNLKIIYLMGRADYKKLMNGFTKVHLRTI